MKRVLSYLIVVLGSTAGLLALGTSFCVFSAGWPFRNPFVSFNLKPLFWISLYWSACASPIIFVVEDREDRRRIMPLVMGAVIGIGIGLSWFVSRFLIGGS
jgi:hypothetical protein